MPTRSGPPQRPLQQRPAGAPTVKTGPLGAVPCPWCNFKMDFRAMAGQDMGGMGEGSIGLETGSVFSCDKCGKGCKIAALDRITIVKLAPVNLAARPATARRR